jgi:hypothetical protein
MNLKYHHFRDFVARGLVTAAPYQHKGAAVLTKPLGTKTSSATVSPLLVGLLAYCTL